ncbi:MAG TPA: hypothetical protein VGX28_01100 [Frankiaceae bacterium]|jgi:hypothetical protein|nr:hypothetical protein [Frankiaceae bacterium]
MRRLLPLVLSAMLAPAAYALPGGVVLPGCTLPAPPPAPSALEGNGYVRLGADGTASWVVNGARWGSWHGASSAYWMEPLDVTRPTPLCVDGVPVALAVRAQQEALGRVAWSPDGTRLAYAEGGVLKVRTGSAVVSYGTVASFAWSPAGDALLVDGPRVVALGGTVTALDVSDAVWGGGRVFGHGDWVYDPDTDLMLPEVVSVLPDGSDRQAHGTGAFAVSGDGTRIALVGEDGFRVVAPDGTDLGSAAVASPDGVTFAADGTVAFTSGAVAHTWDGTAVTAHPTGRLAYDVHWAGTHLWWNDTDAAGTVRLVVDGTAVATAAYAHDLDVVRRDADGSLLVEVERLRGLPTNG